jgi:hypothetical protein
LSFTTPQGQEEATADLSMQPDGTLTGNVASDHGSGSVFSGWASGDKFRFVINISLEGSSSDVVFTGTFEGASMKGSIQAMGYNMEFTGTKPSRMAALQAGGAQ